MNGNSLYACLDFVREREIERHVLNPSEPWTSYKVTFTMFNGHRWPRWVTQLGRIGATIVRIDKWKQMTAVLTMRTSCPQYTA